MVSIATLIHVSDRKSWVNTSQPHFLDNDESGISHSQEVELCLRARGQWIELLAVEVA